MTDGSVLTAVCAGCGKRHLVRLSGLLHRHLHAAGDGPFEPVPGTLELMTVAEWNDFRAAEGRSVADPT